MYQRFLGGQRDLGSVPISCSDRVVEGERTMDRTRIVWRKSSWSVSNSCVEVAFIDRRVAVRDSKDQSGPVLMFTADEWLAFLGGIRNGEFDIEQ